MGKITVTGEAVREYDPEVAIVTFGIETSGKSSSGASKDTTKQCEQLLEKGNGGAWIHPAG